MKDPKTAARHLAMDLSNRPDILVAACRFWLYPKDEAGKEAVQQLADRIEQAIKECTPVADEYGACPVCGIDPRVDCL